jgi:DNA-directed RNA polymerase specialized sigma24 family protein
MARPYSKPQPSDGRIDDTTATSSTDKLWRSHADKLLHFATVLVGPTDTHDILVEAFSDSMDARGVSSQRGYLFRAVANHAHDLRLARERRWTRDLAAIEAPSTAALDTFIDVRRAVAGLSVPQRAVVNAYERCRPV